MMRILESIQSAQLALRAEIEEAIERVSPPHRSLALDREKAFDADLHRELTSRRWMGLGMPTASGGAGGDAMDQIVLLEALGRRGASMAVFFVVHFLVLRMLRTFGSAEQRERLIPSLLSGSAKASFCLTEEGGGTDILATVRTIARQTSDGWVLDGEKTWISGAGESDFLMVVARTAPHRTKGFTAFVVPTDAAGVRVERLPTMALNSYASCKVELRGVHVRAQDVLGEPNDALGQLMTCLNGERINAAAVVNGIARGALERALEYVASRHAFGKPLAQFQAVQHRLATIAVQTESAWLTVTEAARTDATGQPTDVQSGLAKWLSSKAALAATDAGMELLAAAGLLETELMQRFFRDARLHAIAPINNDMILNLLGERWLGLPRSF